MRQAWRRQINAKYVTEPGISRKEGKKQIEKEMIKLIIVKEKSLFDQQLQQLYILLINQPVLKEYFDTRYLSRVKEWAFCENVYNGITTNNFIESFHKYVLK